MSPLSRSLRLLPNLIAAVILLQTLFFKFTAAPESVYIFSTLGLEPIGRIGSGVAELIAALLLLWPASAWVGAALALGIMGGAILSHLTVLGIEVQGDGGQLFLLAVLVAVLSAFVLYRDRTRWMALLAHRRSPGT
ncbi:MAG: DoxX family protein [Flavobacteriales bacterium]|nr:DoxX family protein [Flavobacteriales bacterium]MBK7268154.1 DoxX family protein [Flavobacteriales bacterium]MBK9073533.1 DoxX family protein [Flavobacteriales bacterium]